MRHYIENRTTYILVEIITDTPNILTLAYTYQKPYAGQRHLVRLGAIRPHHMSYALDGVHFVNQQEHGASIAHSFHIPTFTGTWKVYYAAFDEQSPQQAHSISPIWAFEYQAHLYGSPTISFFDTVADWSSLQVGDFVALFNPIPEGNPIPVINATNCSMKRLMYAQLDAAQAWSATPPHNQTFYDIRMHAAQLFRVDALPATFDQHYTGWRIHDVAPTNWPPPWSIRNWPYLNYSPADPAIDPVVQLVNAQESEVCAYFDVGYGSGTITNLSPDPTPAPRLIPGPFTNFTGTIEKRAWSAGIFHTCWIRFKLGYNSLDFLIDITKQWRRLPPNPTPFPE